MFFRCFEPPYELDLESGQRLGPINLAYETYGKLDHSKSNAILVCHALSGDAKVTDWWGAYVGPNKAIDTNRYFVICINTIGSCYGSTGPTSVDPKTGKPYGTTFPVITVTDMVRSQKALIDHLGISRLKAVIGASMGGMQALEWAIHYPDQVAACVPIATSAYLAPQALAFNAVGRFAITSDRNIGLSIARMIGHITYLSNESIALKFGRRLQKKEHYSYDFSEEFEIESYLKYQGDKFVNRFDPDTYLYLSKAMSYFDLVKEYGSLKKAFGKVQAKFLVMSISSDWIYPSKQSKEIVKTLMNLNKEVTYCELDSPYGHDAFLLENDQLSGVIANFLENSHA